jgi:3-hydroxyacyl-[acyl-carrier-protein] dehydratase
MKLIDNFFHIVTIESNATEYKCKVKLNAEHDLYRVHFPGNPVTPGVCLVQMATEILEEKYKKKLLLTSAGSIKFKKMVVPHDEPTFLFSKTILEDNVLRVNASVENDDVQFAKMSLRYIIGN